MFVNMSNTAKGKLKELGKWLHMGKKTELPRDRAGRKMHLIMCLFLSAFGLCMTCTCSKTDRN